MATHSVVPNPSRSATGTSNSIANSRNACAEIEVTAFRAPDYVLHLYTVSRREFTRLAPPLFPRLIIPACKEGERYKKVCDIPHPVNQIEQDPHNPEKTVCYQHDAKRVAMDLCNPSNVSLNLDARAEDLEAKKWYELNGDTNNYIRQGVFWSANEPPTEEEIKAAEKRVESFYRMLLRTLDEIPDSDPTKQQVISGNADAHLACDFFGEERPWHTTFVHKVTCSNCGEKINKGIAFHRSNGAICVLDWKRTLKAGAVKLEDVPEEFRPKAKA
jgi:hypothetical protein